MGRSRFNLRRKRLETGRNCGGGHPCLPVGAVSNRPLPKRGKDAALTGNQGRLPPRQAGRNAAVTRQDAAVLKEMAINAGFRRKPLMSFCCLIQMAATQIYKDNLRSARPAG